VVCQTLAGYLASFGALGLVGTLNSQNVLGMNLYNVYFVSKGTGPHTVPIEAQNLTGAKSQVQARYPGAYNIIVNQPPASAKKK
jgi:hypothetical protein